LGFVTPCANSSLAIADSSNQYVDDSRQFYLPIVGNRIILLTPNEGLSQQHLREFEMAGLAAELFQKDGTGLFAGQKIEILDIHKLKDEMGDKTIAIEAFEGNNLVLVDEGHRGASGGEEGAWMRFRNALCEKGFSVHARWNRLAESAS
jgi:hypothetical protein